MIASVSASRTGSARSSTRTSWVPYIMTARMVRVSFSRGAERRWSGGSEGCRSQDPVIGLARFTSGQAEQRSHGDTGQEQDDERHRDGGVFTPEAGDGGHHTGRGP